MVRPILILIIPIIYLISLTRQENLPEQISKSTTLPESRNVLVFIFPGGKSHNFVFKQLFDFTIQKNELENKRFKYIFHILVHNFDKPIWENSGHIIYGYGNINSYKEKFFDAMEEAKRDPIMGYMGFNNAMKHLYDDFLTEKNLLESLRKINFGAIVSDITNHLSIFLTRELNIPNKIYVNPTCIYVWLNTYMEYNPGYTPSMGTDMTEDMNFYQRFVNFFLVHGTNLFYEYFAKDQNKPFIQNGYKEFINPFQKDALFLNQCVDGFHYSIPIPSNFINLGAIMPKPAKEIKDEKILKFLEKYESVIYVSQGTITRMLRIETIFNVFNQIPSVGFILSMHNLIDLGILKIPDNVLILDWVPQNDLLGHYKIKAFLTHGGLNSILESLYHAKPMIAIGVSIDQINGAALVGYRKVGISITNEKDFNKNFLVESLNKILNDPYYRENCKKISEYVKERDGKEVFYYWLNYTFEVGYKHLLVRPVLEFNHFQKFNLDVILFYFTVFSFVLYISKIIFYRIFKI